MKARKNFESKYGYFTDDGFEYVITNPLTPRPWANVISNGDYSFIVTQNGGGFSFRNNSGQNRLTRSIQDLVKDPYGKYIYLRDTESKKFWSAANKPVNVNYDCQKIRHGIGYSVFETLYAGIRSELTVAVASDAPLEFMKLKVTNESGRARYLDATTYFEWAPGIAPDEHREFHKLFIDTSFDSTLKAILVKKYLWGFADDKGRYNNDKWPYIGFLACSDAVKSYDCDKESFLGLYGHESNPRAMNVTELGRKTGRFGDPVGALQTEVNLQSGESKTVIFVLGAAEDGKESYSELIEKYCSVESCDKALSDVRKMWEGLLSTESITTPDNAMNIMTNTWLKYQTVSCRLWAKSAVYQQSAGFGFRDQLQDSQIFLSTGHAELTKKQILLHASNQFVLGDVQHWWFTIKGWGPRTKCSDDYLWLPFILDAYLKETGDYSILDAKAPYLDGAAESIYCHCKKAIELSFSRFSERGVPLMGDHDWNDGLSAVGNLMKGESFWVAEFLYLILKEFIPLALKKNDAEFAAVCEQTMAQLKETTNKFGWDGEYFLQATNDDGEPVGSEANEEGKIFLNPQIWAVISDITNEERKKSAMGAVSKHLLKDYGALLLTPSYSSPKTNIGYITRYAPGLRENGGVYTHAAAWAVWAYALMGDTEKAYEAYKSICPPNRSEDIDRYISEPYVTAGNSDGPLSPFYGRGGWTWYTGSSQWLHRMATQWIIGVRPTHNGLLINPCIPKEWDGCGYKRLFRGAEYEIEISNPYFLGTGKVELTVDGKNIEGNIVPVFTDGTHTVKAVIKQ